MKKKLSPENKCLLILSIFNASAFAIFIPISAVFNLWGLTIGWGFGFIVTFINMLLLFRSGTATSDTAKESGKGMALTVSFYLLRFILFGVAFVVTALLDYYCHIEVFKYSVFTCAASLLPCTLIITIFYHSDEQVELKENKKQ